MASTDMPIVPYEDDMWESKSDKEAMREKLENIIVDTTLHPVDASLRILTLFDQAIEKKDIESRIDELMRLPRVESEVFDYQEFRLDELQDTLKGIDDEYSYLQSL